MARVRPPAELVEPESMGRERPVVGRRSNPGPWDSFFEVEGEYEERYARNHLFPGRPIHPLHVDAGMALCGVFASPKKLEVARPEGTFCGACLKQHGEGLDLVPLDLV